MGTSCQDCGESRFPRMKKDAEEFKDCRNLPLSIPRVTLSEPKTRVKDTVLSSHAVCLKNPHLLKPKKSLPDLTGEKRAETSEMENEQAFVSDARQC